EKRVAGRERAAQGGKRRTGTLDVVGVSRSQKGLLQSLDLGYSNTLCIVGLDPPTGLRNRLLLERERVEARSKSACDAKQPLGFRQSLLRTHLRRLCRVNLTDSVARKRDSRISWWKHASEVRKRVPHSALPLPREARRFE